MDVKNFDESKDAMIPNSAKTDEVIVFTIEMSAQISNTSMFLDC